MTKHSTRGRLGRLTGVIALAVALVAAACGDDDDDTSSAVTSAGGAPASTAAAASTQPSDLDPNGVMKVGWDLGTSGRVAYSYDPIKMPTPAYHMHALVYDTLLRAMPDGTYKPGLAKSATVVDPQTIRVELNSGIKFSDNTTLDAAAAKFSIDRNVASKNAAPFGSELFLADPVVVDNPTTFTIKLRQPAAGAFYPLLARGETMIVSPTAANAGTDLNTSPVGAGPFKLESITPEVKVRFVKNPSYFQADQIRLAAVEYIHVAPAAQVTALRSGTVDYMDALQVTTANQLSGGGLTVTIAQSDSVHVWSPLCKRDAPLSDQRVRQALNYAIDRDAVNNTVFQGRTEPMWGLFGTKSPLYDASLKDFYKRDVAKAKSLLTAAGYPNGFKLTFLVTPGDSQTISEIIQQQLKEIGVELTLQPSTNIVNDFFTPGKPPLHPGYFFLLMRSGLDKVTRSFVPGGSGNVCDWTHAPLNTLVDQARAVSPDSAEAKTIWSKIQREVMEQAPNVFVVFGASANAHNDKVGGVTYVANFQGLPYMDLFRVYRKK